MNESGNKLNTVHYGQETWCTIHVWQKSGSQAIRLPFNISEISEISISISISEISISEIWNEVR